MKEKDITLESLKEFLNSKTVSRDNMKALMDSYKKRHYVKSPSDLIKLVRN